MKKTIRIICAVLCVAVLASGFCLQSFALVHRFNTNEKVRLYGDIDGDGVVEQSDFEYILGIVSGEIEMPAVGTPEYYAADIMGDGITMEDARRCYRYINGLDTVETYSPAERKVELFNNLVNIIKSKDFTDKLIYYVYEYDFMETKNIDFGVFTDIIKKSLLEEDPEAESYIGVRKGDSVYVNDKTPGVINSNFPATNRATVSTLKVSDIQDMQIEIGVPCTFSADVGVPASYVAKNNLTYNLSGLTAKEAMYTDCIKITVDIKNESYNKDIPDNIKALAKEQLSKKELAEGETPYIELYQPALYNLYGTDIIELGAQYPLNQTESADGMSTSISAQLDDITTAGSVVFYFDRATLNPICASYRVETDIRQHVEMSMSLGSISLDGTMDPRNLMITQTNYWFYDYFMDVTDTIL